MGTGSTLLGVFIYIAMACSSHGHWQHSTWSLHIHSCGMQQPWALAALFLESSYTQHCGMYIVAMGTGSTLLGVFIYIAVACSSHGHWQHSTWSFHIHSTVACIQQPWALAALYLESSYTQHCGMYIVAMGTGSTLLGVFIYIAMACSTHGHWQHSTWSLHIHSPVACSRHGHWQHSTWSLHIHSCGMQQPWALAALYLESSYTQHCGMQQPWALAALYLESSYIQHCDMYIVAMGTGSTLLGVFIYIALWHVVAMGTGSTLIGVFIYIALWHVYSSHGHWQHSTWSLHIHSTVACSSHGHWQHSTWSLHIHSTVARIQQPWALAALYLESSYTQHCGMYIVAMGTGSTLLGVFIYIALWHVYSSHGHWQHSTWSLHIHSPVACIQKPWALAALNLESSYTELWHVVAMGTGSTLLGVFIYIAMACSSHGHWQHSTWSLHIHSPVCRQPVTVPSTMASTDFH